MMKDKMNLRSPEETPAISNETSEVTPANPRKWAYTGPTYRFGIILPGTTTQLKPADMTDAEIDALILASPATKDWFKLI